MFVERLGLRGGDGFGRLRFRLGRLEFGLALGRGLGEKHGFGRLTLGLGGALGRLLLVGEGFGWLGL